MFAITSRYSALPTATYASPDGRVVVYVRRRFVPLPEELAQIGTHVVQPGERRRLDLIAARENLSSDMWWQIADANRAVDPDALTEPAGRRVRITLPAGIPQGAGILGPPNA
jgi:hypothetical protein